MYIYKDKSKTTINWYTFERIIYNLTEIITLVALDQVSIIFYHENSVT